MAEVAACHAMRDLLKAHKYFGDFEIVVAAGNAAGQGADALPPVELAIETAVSNHKAGSITLSFGKLLNGVTVPEWSALFMLRPLKAPESYFQEVTKSVVDGKRVSVSLDPGGRRTSTHKKNYKSVNYTNISNNEA